MPPKPPPLKSPPATAAEGIGLRRPTNFETRSHQGRAVVPIEILLVEDNPGDVRLTQEALKENKIHNRLTVLPDGEAAILYLRQKSPYAAAVRPDLVILDLNLPKKDGREVLREIKEDPTLRSIPVVILTSSEAEEDIAKSYSLHANCFVTKPLGLEGFLKIVHEIRDFWLTIARLPPRP